MKTLVIYPESNTYKDSIFYLFDPDTGECLATHFCSSSGWAKSDLHDDREDRLKAWKEEYNEETEAKFIDETDYKLEEILGKNKNLKQ